MWILKVISVGADVFTIVASGIGIYLFICQRGPISSAFKVLLSYAWRTTLTELKNNIEDLSKLKTDDSTDKNEALNVIGDIVGQINSSKRLKGEWADLLSKLNGFMKNPERLTEPMKRSLTSELRGRLRQLEFEPFEETSGGNDE